MRKKNSVGVITVMMMLTVVCGLAGCGNKIPEMTEEQSKQVGEYAAITLLKYDANHRSRLVDEETIAEYDRKQQSLKELNERQDEKEPTESDGMKPTQDVPVVEKGDQNTAQQLTKSIGESLEAAEGIEVIYQGYRLCDSYPDDGSADKYFALEASEGKKLLVQEFQVTNTTNVDQTLDFFTAKRVFSLSAGNGKRYNAMTTMLLDDLSTYEGTIAAGKSQKLVLLFEIEKNVADEIGEVHLYLKHDSKLYTIQF